MIRNKYFIDDDSLLNEELRKIKQIVGIKEVDITKSLIDTSEKFSEILLTKK